MELGDILPEHVQNRVKRAGLAGGEVVRQRVDPHIHAVPAVHVDRPRHAAERPAHAEILRAFFDRANHGVEAARRNDLRVRRASRRPPSRDGSAETPAEPACISGDCGSGTIFFSNCNLKCIYCQNFEISTKNCGKEISIEDFANICISLQQNGALNINLVTPTHFIPLIRDGLLLAKKKGLHIPIVYNTSSYETIDSLKMLDGLIDIYLADLKYYDNKLGEIFSGVKNYFLVAKKAIGEMYRQIGVPKFNGSIMKKGVIVRHLLLPTHSEDSKKILAYLHDTYKDNIYISIMNQYTPIRKIEKYKELNSKVDDYEYDLLINYACDIGITNAFIQEGDTCSESFIPDFGTFSDK